MVVLRNEEGNIIDEEGNRLSECRYTSDDPKADYGFTEPVHLGKVKDLLVKCGDKVRLWRDDVAIFEGDEEGLSRFEEENAHLWDGAGAPVHDLAIYEEEGVYFGTTSGIQEMIPYSINELSLEPQQGVTGRNEKVTANKKKALTNKQWEDSLTKKQKLSNRLGDGEMWENSWHRGEAHCVYLIMCGEWSTSNYTNNHLIKIGMSKNVESRRKNLQASNPHPLLIVGLSNSCSEKLARYIERSLHLHYAKCSLRGEWFSLPREQVRWIANKLFGQHATETGRMINELEPYEDKTHTYLFN